MTKGSTLKNAALGLVLTFMLYLVPGLNFFAPLIGGAAAGYSQRQGLEGGFKVGVVMAALIMLPSILFGLLLSHVLGTFMASVGTLAITMFVTGHAIILGIIGSMIGGLFSQKKDI